MTKLKISYKLYTTIFILLFIGISTPVLVTEIYQEPVSGDLTRIGYYSENEYGWSGSKFTFNPVLSEHGELAKNYDIVILGDSFSIPGVSNTPEGSFWTNELKNLSGLSVGVFHIEKYNEMKVLTDYINRDSPPKIIIYQSVERDLKARLGRPVECSDRGSHAVELTEIQFNTLNIEPQSYQRDTALSDIDYGYTLKYLFHNLTQHKFKGRVIEQELSSDQLFSNSRSGYMLYLKDDLKKASWSKQDWENIYCNALDMQGRVQKNGETRFVFLVAPDKSTIYSSVFNNKVINHSMIRTLDREPLNFVRVDNLLINKLAEGEKDIYLPNDSHWSSTTHFWVARQVINLMNN